MYLHLHTPTIRTATKGGESIVYTVVVIDHTARTGKLYMGESENIWKKL